MARINVLAYPLEIHQSVRTIGVELQLEAGLSAATDIILNTARTSSSVTLVTDPLTGQNVWEAGTVGVRVFLQVSLIPLPEHSVPVVLPSGAKQSLSITFQVLAALGGGNSDTIAIGYNPDVPEIVTTAHKFQMSDDFTAGVTLPTERWTTLARSAFSTTVWNRAHHFAADGVTNMVAANLAADLVNLYQVCQSEMIQGKAHVEFRGVWESARTNHSCFALVVGFRDEKVQGGGGGYLDLLTGFRAGMAMVGFNALGQTVTGAAGGDARPFKGIDNLATTIHFNCASEWTTAWDSQMWGTDEVLTLALGGLTTAHHDYVLDFDGHQVVLSIDGLVVATRRLDIPNVTAKWFTAAVVAFNDGVAPGVNTYLYIDRIDMVADERLVTAAASVTGSGTGDATAANQVLQMEIATDGSQRALVNTDEDTVYDDFPGAAITRARTGVWTFYAGGTGVVGVGTAFLTELRVGQYVRANVHANNGLAQIEEILSDTELVLATNYQGAISADYATGSGPYQAAYDGTNFWISNFNDNNCSVLDAVTGVPVGFSPVATGLNPWGIAHDGLHTWIANSGAGTVTAVVTATGVAMVGSPFVTAAGPRWVATDGVVTNVWITCETGNAITVLVAATGLPAAFSPIVLAGGPFGVCLGGAGGNMWVTSIAGNTVSRYVAATGVLVAAYATGAGPRAVCYANLHIWVGNSGATTLTELLAATGALVGTYTLPYIPYGMAFDGIASIWVSHSANNAVTQVTEATGAIVATYAVGTFPLGVGSDGAGRVWVTNFNAASVTAVTVATTPITTGAAVSADWYPTVQGAGATLTVGAGFVALAPALTAVGLVSLLRPVGIASIKHGAPLESNWYGNIDNRRLNQSLLIGFTEEAGGVGSGSWFSFTGVVSTTVNCVSRSSGGATETQTTAVTYDAASTSVANHRYCIRQLLERVEFLIDDEIVATHETHYPAPYRKMISFARFANTNIPAGATIASFDFGGHLNFADLRTEDNQEGDTIDLQGYNQSKPYPDPSSNEDLEQLQLRLDPAGNLVTRGAVTTDEASFNDDFLTGTVWRVITGNWTFTTNANVVTCPAGIGLALTELREGDYLELAADHNDVAPVWVQILSIQDNNNITLVLPYTGAGGAAGATRACNYRLQLGGAGAAYFVANSILVFDPGMLQDTVVAYRNIGVGGRKGYAPMRSVWYGGMQVRQANNYAKLGLVTISPLGLIDADQGAFFLFDGAVNTQVTCRSQSSSLAATHRQDTVAVLPGGATTFFNNLYEVHYYPDRAVFYINHVEVASHPYHLPDPYQPLAQYIEMTNTAVPALANSLYFNWNNYTNLDDVRVEMYQPDAAALHVTADVEGVSESLQYPDPHTIEGADARVYIDSAGNLRTRSAVLTDEGSFNDDFHGPNLWAVLTGNWTFIAGSTQVICAGGGAALTEVREGDYVELTADHNDMAPAWAQVQSVEDNDHITLVTAYGGAGGAAGASRVQNYVAYMAAGGAAYAVLLSVLRMTVTAANGDEVSVWRRIGVGGRKGYTPVRSVWRGSIVSRLADQNGRFGLMAYVAGAVDNDVGAYFYLDGLDPTRIICHTASDAGAFHVWDEAIYLPNGGSTFDRHTYEILHYPDRAEFVIDGVQVANHPYHLTDPYQELVIYSQLINTAASGVNGIDWDWVGYANIDDAKVESCQSNPQALHTAAHLFGYARSTSYPNPLVTKQSMLGAVTADWAGNLLTRGAMLTDEGSFGDDFGFNAAGLAGVLTSVWVFTAGSTEVVCNTGLGVALTEVREGDYLELGADDAPAAPVFVQVARVDSNNHITLVAPYAGAGGAAGAAFIQNYIAVEIGVGAAIGVALGYATLAPALANASICSITRRIGVAGRKGTSPLRSVWYNWITGRQVNQTSVFGLVATTTAGVYDMNRCAVFVAQDTDQHVITCYTRNSVGAGNTYTEDVYLPNSGVTSGAHLYEVQYYQDRVVFLIDHVQVAQHEYHIPDPYTEMGQVAFITNGGALANNYSLNVDFDGYANIDDARVETYQPDPERALETARVVGEGRTTSYPNPTTTYGDDVKVRSDQAGNLLVHAEIANDEGGYADDFLGATPQRALTGNWQFTLASRSAFVPAGGGAALTEIREGDYVELVADDAPAAPVWVQVEKVNDNDHITLASPYAGAGGAAGASSVQNYISTVTGAGSSLTTANSLDALLAANVISTVRIARRVGVAGRKGFAPLRSVWYGAISARYAASQILFLGFEPMTVAGVVDTNIAAGFLFTGATNTVVTCRTRSSVAAADTWDENVVVPAGGTTAGYHLYEVLWYPDRVVFHIDGIELAMHYYHLLDPYTEVGAVATVMHTAAPGGATTLNLNWAGYQNISETRVEARQANAGNLNATVQDRTPFGLSTGLAWTFFADASVQIASVVVGRRYRICVEGGAGCVINTRNGVAARGTDQSYLSGDNWDTFIATRVDVFGQTLVAAAAFSTVKLILVD